MSVPYKVCPKCGQRAVLSMQACGRCGYSYVRRRSLVMLGSGVAAAILLAGFFVFAALRFTTNPLTGAWRSKFGKTLTLYANGTYTERSRHSLEWDGPPQDYIHKGRWKLLSKGPSPLTNGLSGTLIMDAHDPMIRTSEFDIVTYTWMLSEDGGSLRLIQMTRPDSPEDYMRVTE